MEVFTLQEWEENFDVLFKRVEDGETIGVVREDGKAAVFMLLMRQNFCEYTQQTITTLIDVFGTIAYWLMPTAYNGVNWVQFPVVLPGGLAIW